MIELLVVIAIIAILTAIIFPVFATVRENARASSSLQNMHQISTALYQFQLDNHKKPDVLFGYVYHQNDNPANPIVPMDKALAQAQQDNPFGYGAGIGADRLPIASRYFPGLYPEYIKDVNAFRDPNNPVDDLSKNANNPHVNVLCPSSNDACAGQANGTLVVAADTQTTSGVSETFPHDFYAVDAYDVSPKVTDTNTLTDPAVYVPRYQAAWTSIGNALDCTYVPPPSPPTQAPNEGQPLGLCANNRNDYTRQMHWRNPPADAYVTSTTYHVPNNNKVLVLFENGSAKKRDLSQFLATGAGGATQNDVADIGVTAANCTSFTNNATPPVTTTYCTSQANFWKAPIQ